MSTTKPNYGILYAIAITAIIIGVAQYLQMQVANIDISTLEPLWANAVTYVRTILLSTQVAGGAAFIFGMYGYEKNRLIAKVRGTTVAFDLNYYLMTLAALLGEFGITLVSTQGRPDLQQLGQGIVAFANILKSVAGDLFGNQSAPSATITKTS